MGLESKTREVITEKFADNDLGKRYMVEYVHFGQITQRWMK